MILEALLSFLFAIVELVLSILPSGDAPAWISNAGGYLEDVWAAGAGLGAWIPWTVVGTVFSACMAALLLGFTIKVVRIVASFFTAGGGSAA